jgi:hypothetical protein
LDEEPLAIVQRRPWQQAQSAIGHEDEGLDA